MDPAQEIFDVVRAGNTDRLRTLLADNPGLAGVRNARGHTPVLIAQYHHQPDAVAILLAAEPELDIFDAAAVGRTDRVAVLLDGEPALLDAFSTMGFTPLGLAAFFGHVETVTLLMARGADPKRQNAQGISPIGLAAKDGRLDILKLLKGQA